MSNNNMAKELTEKLAAIGGLTILKADIMASVDEVLASVKEIDNQIASLKADLDQFPAELDQRYKSQGVKQWSEKAKSANKTWTDKITRMGK